MTNQPSSQTAIPGVGNCQPLENQPSNPTGQGLVGNGPLLGGPAKLPTPDRANSENANPLVPTLDELCGLKERIDAGVSYCRKHRSNDRLHSKGHARLTRILARDYLPALDALKTAYPIEQLEQERETTIGRLEKGWQLADTESRARTFAKLLARYEILTDAIDGDVLARHLGRAV